MDIYEYRDYLVDFFKDTKEVSINTRRSTYGLPPDTIMISTLVASKTGPISTEKHAMGSYKVEDLQRMFEIPMDMLPTLIDDPKNAVNNAFYLARLIKGV
jgi:hypothetical protein